MGQCPTGFQPWPIMHAPDRLHREFGEQPVIDHGPGACITTLFSRLENTVNRAIEVTMPCQIFRCTKQHGRMTIMATGMHSIGMSGRIGKIGLLLHGKRVHIRPEADRW